MREHEYRAWDKKLNIMWEAIEMKKLLRYLVFESMPNATAYKEIKDHFDDIVWLQYLNHKDKNGEKFFEGDIAQMEAVTTFSSGYYHEEDMEIDLLYTGEVVIIPSKGVCLKNPMCIDRLEDNKKWRIKGYKNVVSYRSKKIGDKFQNPELLNE